ncbi:hypothetical protein ACCS63_36070, partial [Rhizobium brockwellii]
RAGRCICDRAPDEDDATRGGSGMTLIANRPSQKLVDLVGALGGTWHRNVATCRCPAHTDKTPSLSLRQGDRGILVTCFGVGSG